VRVALVRGGEDFRHQNGAHRLPAVYGEMMLQVAQDYSGAPDVLNMRAHQIRFFYNGIRRKLQQETKPSK
jgi:hypothetical protein